MKRWVIGLLFPESDDEILEMDSKAEVKDLCKWFQVIKRELDSKNMPYVFYYDSDNMETFARKVKELYSDIYLDDSLVQLRRLLGARSQNIKSGRQLFQPECYYVPWNIHKLEFEVAPNLLKVLMEKKLEENEIDAYLLSFVKSDKYKRDVIPIVKDALHVPEMPQMAIVQYCHPISSFIGIIRSKNSARIFSLRDVTKFERTNYIYHPTGQRIYLEKEHAQYWYYDFFHKDNYEHYEVFDCETLMHIAEADINGILDEEKRDPNKSLKRYIR